MTIETLKDRSEAKEIDGVIYKATNLVNGKVYIGQTTKKLSFRKNAHLNEARKFIKKTYFHRAILKYGNEGFKWEIIDIADSKEELDSKEVYWISYYNSFGEGGYNLTVGGGGLLGYKPTKDNIAKASARMKKAWNDGTMDIRGSNHPMTDLTDEDVYKIVNILKKGEASVSEIGEMFSVNTPVIANIKAGRSWRHIVSEEDRIQMALHDKQPISDELVIKIKDELIKGEKSIPEIAKNLDVSTNSIYAIQRGSSYYSILTKDDIMKMELNKKKRLEEEEILEIIALLKNENLFMSEIAETYNLDISMVSMIKSGKRWTHLSNEEDLYLMKNRKVTKKQIRKKKKLDPSTKKYVYKFTGMREEDVIKVKKLLIEGKMSQKEIADAFNVHQPTISLIKNGKKYSEISVPMWEEYLETIRSNKSSAV